MPPGTGDIQLTLSQIMNISAAVIVTTPQRLSFVDVVKGIDLFDTVNIPCVAVVGNVAQYMTYDFNTPSDFYENLNAQITGLYTAMILSTPATATKQDLFSSIERTTESVTSIIQSAIESQKKPVKLFGEGHTHRLKDMWGIDNIIRLPLIDEVSLCGDKGLPYVLENPKSDISYAMLDLASLVIQEINKLEDNESNSNSDGTKAGTNLIQYNPTTNEISYNPQKSKTNDISSSSPSSPQVLSPYTLRINCRCATCVEEFTGQRLLDINSINKATIKPMTMNRIGRYAVAVDWSDGHKSLYPFRAIATLATNSKQPSVDAIV